MNIHDDITPALISITIAKDEDGRYAAIYMADGFVEMGKSRYAIDRADDAKEMARAMERDASDKYPDAHIVVIDNNN